jgi:hypothetical protein
MRIHLLIAVISAAGTSACANISAPPESKANNRAAGSSSDSNTGVPGKASDKPTATGPAEGEAFDVTKLLPTGVWIGDCALSETTGPLRKSYQIRLEFTEKIKVSTTTYYDRNDSGARGEATSSFVSRSNIRLEMESNVVKKARAFLETNLGTVFTILSSSFAQDANQSRLLGFQDWQVGTTRPFLGAIEPQNNIFQIVAGKIDGVKSTNWGQFLLSSPSFFDNRFGIFLEHSAWVLAACVHRNSIF